MALIFTKRYRHIKRYREIANIISKHGLSQLLNFLGPARMALPWKKEEPFLQPLNAAHRLRLVLQELGPTFIKLGQILSTRPDLLSPVYIIELEKLQDKVPAVDFNEVKATLEGETGKPVHAIFAWLSQEPLASASIGQVHEGTLLSGEHVVLKVQRPGVDKVIRTDLEIMYDVAKAVEARTEWGRYYKVTELVDEFARSITEELDYTTEARNADRMKENFVGDPSVKIPKVYWEYSSTRVLILEYAEGIKVTSDKELTKANVDKTKLAKTITNAIFKQVLFDGFFHADPHPGNLSVSKDGSIIFLDFGMVGRLDDWMKEQLGLMLLHIVRRDVDGIVRVLLDLGNAHREVDKLKLKRDINHLFDKYYNRPLGEIKIGYALRDLLELSFVYRIRVPVELVLMIRCFVLLESIVERLDENLSIVDLAEPFGKKLLQEKMVPGRLAKAASNYMFEISSISAGLPRRLDNLIRTLEDGELNIKLEHRNLNRVMSRFNIIGNRVSFSLIVASIIIGSSLIAQKSPQKLLWRLPIAEVGFITALVMGLWLVVSIIRSGRI